MKPLTNEQLKTRIHDLSDALEVEKRKTPTEWEEKKNCSAEIFRLNAEIDQLKQQLENNEKRMPCGFCGSHRTYIERELIGGDNNDCNDVLHFIFGCLSCNTEVLIDKPTLKEALDFWNTRAE